MQSYPTYAILPTRFPTKSPATPSPTAQPSSVPTYDPTSFPTWQPSNDPTLNPTHEPTETVSICTYNHNSIINIEIGKNIEPQVQIRDIMEISFDLRLEQPLSCSRYQYCHIFAIGYRKPLIFTHNGALISSFTYSGSNIAQHSSTDAYAIISDGNWHHLSFKYTFTEVIVQVDGITYVAVEGSFDFDVDETLSISTVWGSPSANQYVHGGKIRNICINSLYPSPTAHPTEVPTSNPSMFPTNDPSSNPTDIPTRLPTTPSPTLLIHHPTVHPSPAPPSNGGEAHESVTSTTTLNDFAPNEISESSTSPSTTHNVFFIVISIFGAIIFGCIICLLSFIIYKLRSDKANTNIEIIATNMKTDCKLEMAETQHKPAPAPRISNMDITRMRAPTESTIVYTENDDVKCEGLAVPATTIPPGFPGTEMMNQASDTITMTADISVAQQAQNSTPTSEMEIAPYGLKRQVTDEGFAETGGGGGGEEKVELDDAEIVYDDGGVIEVRQWLTLTCGKVLCEKYYDAFVTNGYQSLDFIKEIEGKSDLADIGITLKGHQVKIFSQIKKLKE